ncbi:MAG TPA: phospholipase D family protein [Polyangiaceae bacterium]|nr:phospholipase D family protein [Polyangiaceae bacterium]
MATIEILGHARAMGERLSADLRDASQCSIAVAFAKESALQAVNLEGWVGPQRKLKLLAGTDFTLTELGLLRRLAAPHAECRIYHMVSGTTFHPKLYVIDKPDRRVAYVGSSNLTYGGLSANIEANVRIEGDALERELKEPEALFDRLFTSELATPLSDEFEARYQELQEERRVALVRYTEPQKHGNLQIAESLLIGQYRARVASQRHILVVTPRNYDFCMRSLTVGRKKESEINRFNAGDVFFFHLTERRGIRAMGMFVGPAYYDDADVWKNMDKGSYPWRRRFLVLGELRTELPTRALLEPLRPRAPKNWFNGFIVASHSLSQEDFEALREAFEQALRKQCGLQPMSVARGPVSYPSVARLLRAGAPRRPKP